MDEPTQTTVSRLVGALEGNDREALDAVFSLVYGEIRALAHRQRQRWVGDHTLSTTALVHEAYLKLSAGQGLDVDGRAHFLALAARAVRQILINYAESRRAQKRGGGLERVTLSEARGPAPPACGRTEDLSGDEAEVLVALDASLRELGLVHARQARVVECRFFGGMTVDETAVALGVSPRTVKRDWAVAQAWLHRRMEGAA